MFVEHRGQTTSFQPRPAAFRWRTGDAGHKRDAIVAGEYRPTFRGVLDKLRARARLRIEPVYFGDTSSRNSA